MLDVPNVSIRSLKPTDMSMILSVSCDTPNRWRGKDFEKCLKRKNSTGFVISTNDQIIGFAIIEVFKDHFHLLNIAIQSEYRRKKIGTKLMDYMIDQLIPTKKKRIMVELREHDLTSQLFFRSSKFRATETLKAYYEDTTEDAYRMEYRLAWPLKSTKNDKKGCYVKVNG